ncbi:MAG TPA: branched-chain amino acid ABC transporter substrate-binding protein [Acidimicrobiales bacterium]|nr:branched-chain amino acid ABC transporter substrate-binding protein [Acidimicrobiales bacterium]
MPRNTRSWWRLSAVLLALSLIAAACGNDDDGASGGEEDSGGGDKQTVALAYVGPKTGDAANLGIFILNGAKVAVKQANEKSDKFNFVLKEFDTQGDPAQAPGQAAKYIADQEIVGVVGPAFSGESKAVLKNLQEANLVMVSASATASDIPGTVPGQTVFHRVLPDDAAQAAGIAKYLKAKQAGKSVAYVHDNQDYSKGLADAVAKAATANGHRNLGTFTVDKNSQDFSAAVNSVKGAKPDIVFYGGYYAEAGRLKKQLSDAGVTALFMSGDGALDQGFLKGAGSGPNNSIISCPCNLATEAAGGRIGTFAKDYKAEHGSEPGTYSSEAFDAANILIEGIEAGNTTREKLLAHVEGLPAYDGISKKIEFVENGNLSLTTVYFFQVKDGEFAPLTTTDDF